MHTSFLFLKASTILQREQEPLSYFGGHVIFYAQVIVLRSVHVPEQVLPGNLSSSWDSFLFWLMKALLQIQVLNPSTLEEKRAVPRNIGMAWEHDASLGDSEPWILI